ncbi:MAG: magnesium/cobalt transporter CorA [Pseudomonadales bacterium]
MTYLRRRYHAPGTSPGTYDVAHTREAESSSVAAVDYSANTLAQVEDPRQLGQPVDGSVRWVRITGHPSLDVLESLRSAFDIDPLVLEDIVNSGQRPKVDFFDDALFVTLAVPGASAEHPFQQLSIYVTGNTLISHVAGEQGLFAPLMKRLQQPQSHLRRADVYFLLYAIIDLAIDHLFPLLDDLGNRLEALEDEILTDPTQALLGEVHQLRNTMLVLRKVTWATRELLSELLRALDSDQAELVRRYLQDSYDHIVSAVDLVETFRDMATSLIEVHLSVISNRMNDIMKVLTIIATIFIPPTFLVGVYGMNFDRTAGPWSMPELSWPFGYLIVMGIIALMMTTMLIYFRHKRWL